jgi:hypothetical protein
MHFCGYEFRADLFVNGHLFGFQNVLLPLASKLSRVERRRDYELTN